MLNGIPYIRVPDFLSSRKGPPPPHSFPLPPLFFHPHPPNIHVSMVSAIAGYSFLDIQHIQLCICALQISSHTCVLQVCYKISAGNDITCDCHEDFTAVLPTVDPVQVSVTLASTQVCFCCFIFSYYIACRTAQGLCQLLVMVDAGGIRTCGCPHVSHPLYHRAIKEHFCY